jgi:hypothetical protein
MYTSSGCTACTMSRTKQHRIDRAFFICLFARRVCKASDSIWWRQLPNSAGGVSNGTQTARRYLKQHTHLKRFTRQCCSCCRVKLAVMLIRWLRFHSRCICCLQERDLRLRWPAPRCWPCLQSGQRCDPTDTVELLLSPLHSNLHSHFWVVPACLLLSACNLLSALHCNAGLVGAPYGVGSY